MRTSAGSRDNRIWRRKVPGRAPSVTAGRVSGAPGFSSSSERLVKRSRSSRKGSRDSKASLAPSDVRSMPMRKSTSVHDGWPRAFRGGVFTTPGTSMRSGLSGVSVNSRRAGP